MLPQSMYIKTYLKDSITWIEWPKIYLHSVEITEFYCHCFFANFSVKSTFYCTKELDSKSIWRKNVLSFGKYFVKPFWQKFRESNSFDKKVTKELIWRNVYLVRVCTYNTLFIFPLILELLKQFLVLWNRRFVWILCNFVVAIFSQTFCERNCFTNKSYHTVQFGEED